MSIARSARVFSAVFVSSLFFSIILALPHGVNADYIGERNSFESYSVGTTSLGANWTATNENLYVTNTITIPDGSKALNITGTSSTVWACTLKHTLTETQDYSDGDIANYTWWARVSNTAATDWVMHLYAPGIPNAVISFMVVAGSVRAYYAASSYATLGTMSINTWYAFRADINMANDTWGWAYGATMPTAPTGWGAVRNQDYDATLFWVGGSYQSGDTLSIDDFQQVFDTPPPYGPVILSSPDESVDAAEEYTFDAVSTVADNGPTDWTLTTNATWLTVEGSPDGTKYCNLSGTPGYGDTGSYWANLSVADDNSSDYINWTITVVNPPGVDLVFESSNPVRVPDDAWESTVLCEQVDWKNESGGFNSWYRGNYGASSKLGYSTSTDGVTWVDDATNPYSDPVGFAYWQGVEYAGCFYLFGVNLTDKDLYMWNATDKENLVPMNGGEPVYTNNPTSSAWDYSLFNCGVVIVGDTWHMLMEGKPSGLNFVMGYSYSNLTELNWTAHRSLTYLWTLGGNPYLCYEPEHEVLLSVHGNLTGGTWYISAHYASIYSDLDAQASWHPIDLDDFNISVEGIHIADPHMVQDFNETYGLMLSYGYDQTDIYQCYYAGNLTAFYEEMMGSAWGPTFTSSPDTSQLINTAYSYQAACNESVTWGAYIATNASWLTWSATNHTVYGMPEVANMGAFYVDIPAISVSGRYVEHQNYTLTVAANMPSITSSVPGNATEDAPWYYLAQADDSGTWGLTTNASWVTRSSNNYSGTPSNLYSEESYYVNVTNTGPGGEDYQNFTVFVYNRAPVFSTTPVTNGTTGVMYVYDAITDDETTGGNYTLETNYPAYMFDGETGELSFSGAEGDYWFNLTANDNRGAANSTVYQNWTVEVEAEIVISDFDVSVGVILSLVLGFGLLVLGAIIKEPIFTVLSGIVWFFSALAVYSAINTGWAILSIGIGMTALVLGGLTYAEDKKE